MKVFLHFDFYGAGNIGDDLMLGGLLGLMPPSHELTCVLPRDITSQQKRFPRVRWIQGDRTLRVSALAQCDVVVGVGGTPFQITSGDGFLRQQLDDMRLCREWGKPMFMIGVGAEAEAVEARNTVRSILSGVRQLSTRDQFTAALLVDQFGYDADRVVTGSDLAHIVLSQLQDRAGETTTRPYAVGVCYFEQHPRLSNMISLNSIFRRLSRERRMIFVANEVRRTKPYEWWTHKRVSTPLLSFSGNPGFSYYEPDYEHADILRLVDHYAHYDTVLAARYHSILAAAWAGCRVVAFNRGSKIRAVAEELGIPLVSPPFTYAEIVTAIHNAVKIERSILLAMHRKAVSSARQLLAAIAGVQPNT
jgi:polysaccharide pyruvyl transferase WcaK-like protein